MSDIVERLRWRAENTSRPEATTPRLCAEAADEIKRLREWNAEIALNAREFADVLREIAKYEIEEGCPCNACRHSALARSALGPR